MCHMKIAVRTFETLRNVMLARKEGPVYVTKIARCRWGALARSALWVLRKCHAELWGSWHDEVPAYDVAELDTSRLMEMVSRNARNIRMLYNQEAKYIVVGYDKFLELVRVKSELMYFSTDFTAHLNGIDGVRVMGLKLVVVPWVDGIFVLPDLEKQ